MREIIFRGKDRTGIINHSWQVGPLDNTNAEFRKSIRLDRWGNQMLIDVVLETVGQYTGLTDKNGKRIFEGDIVQYYGTYPLEVYIEKGHTKIRWYDTISASKYDELFFSSDREGYGECEIIGNIHDNPELLKGGAE